MKKFGSFVCARRAMTFLLATVLGASCCRQHTMEHLHFLLQKILAFTDLFIWGIYDSTGSVGVIFHVTNNLTYFLANFAKHHKRSRTS